MAKLSACVFLWAAFLGARRSRQVEEVGAAEQRSRPSLGKGALLERMIQPR
jgi:hypothetical protein